MYEFTKKEIRKQFKETQYGKKTNCWLYISLIVFFVVCIAIPFIFGFAAGVSGLSLEETEKMFMEYADILDAATFISLAIVLYFDGKRDGAIEQFKRDLNSKKIGG